MTGIVLTAILGWVVWDELRQEWVAHQKTYYRLVLRHARNEQQREWARGQRIEVKQLEPKELGTVERCVICHLAVDNPLFRGAPEPFRVHSSLLKGHPPQRFGCVVCHGGEGRAVTALEAHGHAGLLAKPLLVGDYMQAACYKCHGEKTLPPEAIPSVVRGRQLVNRYLCLGCHQIQGEGGEEGPDLSVVGSHRNWLWLYAHLAKPKAMVPVSTMPVFNLSRDEIKDITIYLMTLLEGRDQLWNMSLGAKRFAKGYEPGREEKGQAGEEMAFSGANSGGKFPYDGKALFRGAGCGLCHIIGNRGGEVGPALTYIGRKRKAEDLERLLKDPEQLLPGGKMPRLYLNEQQIKALVAYLSSLQ